MCCYNFKKYRSQNFNVLKFYYYYLFYKSDYSGCRHHINIRVLHVLAFCGFFRMMWDYNSIINEQKEYFHTIMLENCDCFGGMHHTRTLKASFPILLKFLTYMMWYHSFLIVDHKIVIRYHNNISQAANQLRFELNLIVNTP